MTARPVWTGHPRGCGENKGVAAGRCRHVRAIPARAGRTVTGRLPVVRAIGPSPRVRGEPGPLCPSRPGSRAIPARAGRTSGAIAWRALSTGHPRACGENFSGRWGCSHEPPGHPRACGENPHPAQQGINQCRAIPARAGRTHLVGCQVRDSLRAIPARAGRTSIDCLRVIAFHGPSPRVRGELGGAGWCPSGSPGHPRACGENLSDGTQTGSRDPGHPRACGENPAVGPPTPGCCGPSPRVRGERPKCLHGSERFARAIPARAGRTFKGKPSAHIVHRAIPARAGRT